MNGIGKTDDVGDADHPNDVISEDGGSSSSDVEEEWVPSCWDSMAQPSRSALKSPDKSSSVSILICKRCLVLSMHRSLRFLLNAQHNLIGIFQTKYILLLHFQLLWGR